MAHSQGLFLGWATYLSNEQLPNKDLRAQESSGSGFPVREAKLHLALHPTPVFDTHPGAAYGPANQAPGSLYAPGVHVQISTPSQQPILRSALIGCPDSVLSYRPALCSTANPAGLD